MAVNLPDEGKGAVDNLAAFRIENSSGKGEATAIVGLSTGAYQNNHPFPIAVSGAATDPKAHAGWFEGKVHVSGNLSKTGGGFKIDHPKDPANKYLNHSFVESSERMNIYSGKVKLDGKGEAVVELSGWCGELNTNFCYQLTAIGSPSPGLYIAKEIEANLFTIAGGEANKIVCWQVTGIRHDLYAAKYPLQVEEGKEENVGRYLHPELYGPDLPGIGILKGSAQSEPKSKQ